MGVEFLLEYIGRFGFDVARMPRNLSLSLGSGEVTPLEVVSGYAVFSNGGYRVEPYFVNRIEMANGDLVMQAEPAGVCPACPEPELDEDGEPVDLAALVTLAGEGGGPAAKRVLDPRNAWIMNSLLQGVIKHGTGRRALQLKRPDLSGKTGTTNEQKDAWFSGFNGRVATTTWVGFDQSQPLGRLETGARAALPMWIDYMRHALDGMPETQMERPPKLVAVRIDPATGLLSGADNPNSIFEFFREEYIPKRSVDPGQATIERGADPALSEQLF
jgi:penicillin-binding protein 1A